MIYTLTIRKCAFIRKKGILQHSVWSSYIFSIVFEQYEIISSIAKAKVDK